MLSSETACPPLSILCPPDAVPSKPPVTTRIQLLPFGELSWENFERLCHRLTALDGDIEHCARYGQQGEAQEGIDIFARQKDSFYHCLQAKRHRDFGPNKLRNAVDLFLAGRWAMSSRRFTIAVQASLGSTKEQNEIERQAERLAEHNIVFELLDGEKLTDRLRHHPVLVDDFFGRLWVCALLGQEVADRLGTRLDGAAFASVRSQLARVYHAQFHFFDPGSFGSIDDEDGRPELSLLERFLKPDMLVREIAQSKDGGGSKEAQNDWSDSSRGGAPYSLSGRSVNADDIVAVSRMRRLPLSEWLGESQRMVVVGDAGCGKSTLLRVVALDLLQDQQYFPELAARWGQFIPIYIPFARWASHVARDANAIGVKEIVRRSLEQLLTASIVDLLDRAINEQRVLLLIDGLDEWANEQSARATLSTLVTTVEAHGIPVIVSGRPRGLSRIGTLPTHWKRGTVAPLSSAQQSLIAGRWFARYSSTVPPAATSTEAQLRTARLMGELARDANLGALASVPLLLVGLITLALRGQALPRTRNDIYDQLVRVLLDVHPENRATAAGDTSPRFGDAWDATQRRATIARLAFAVREQTGGAGILLKEARGLLSGYLTSSSQGFEFTEVDAVAAVNEILSVNAETQGLIVEKAAEEIGFVHSSFEEFLSAEHIGSWPFAEIEEFVRAHANEGRWRNVITNLIGQIQRPDEINRLVAIIETPEPDEMARYQRQFLIGDIAAGPARRSIATAKRLAMATICRVENEDWMPARREALTSVMRGLIDPTLKNELEQRLQRWVPALLPQYGRAALIQSFGSWSPTQELQDRLFQCMHDEEREVQRSAAAAYARAFSHSDDASQRLIKGLAQTRDLSAAASFLESLALGWASLPAAAALFNQAWCSGDAEMRLVGILGLVTSGSSSEEARDVVVRCQGFWSGLSHPYRELAGAMLMKYWPADSGLVEDALKRASQQYGSNWEYDVAIAYLMESPVSSPTVRAWILEELKRDFPFNITNDTRAWSHVGRFAAVDHEIRNAANAYWCDPENQLINLNKLPSYVAWVADSSLMDVLIVVVSEKKRNFGRYWALLSLLTGWGRDHPEVRSALDALAMAPDEDLEDLAAFLPEIMRDKVTARTRLIRMSVRPQLRRDMLASGFVACGCDAYDDEAVAAIFAFPNLLRGAFNPSYQLFHNFGTHPRVREFARACLRDAGGALPTIAEAYPNDPEFASSLLNAGVPLPVELRTQIVDMAAAGASGTALEQVLSKAFLENDPELRARMIIAYHRTLPPEAHDAAKQVLLAQATAVGGDHHSVRASALAGLATIGELDAVAELKERGKHVPITTGSYGYNIASVERLICERFEEFQAAFGDNLQERFESHGYRHALPAILSTAPSASLAAKAAFLAFAERGEIPRTSSALRALAAERPSSNLLLERCWDAIDRKDRRNDDVAVNGEIGLILREHFAGIESVRIQLIDRYKKQPRLANAILLAIFDPYAGELPHPLNPAECGRELGDWAVAIYVASHRAHSSTFCELLEAATNRRRYSQFDAQQIINLAVEERLLRDPEMEGLMGSRLEMDVDPSISGSFARYLAAAGKFSPDARSRALNLLGAFSANQRLPVAGFDAVADKWRATRVTLLDAVSAALDLY